jgi:hypothetical protein
MNTIGLAVSVIGSPNGSLFGAGDGAAIGGGGAGGTGCAVATQARPSQTAATTAIARNGQVMESFLGGMAVSRARRAKRI